jgi:hypothetical protein
VASDPLYSWMQTEHTCGCGLYIHPDSPDRNPKAIHIPDCPYGRVIALEAEVGRLTASVERTAQAFRACEQGRKDEAEFHRAEVERLVAASGDSMVHMHFARVVTERNRARAEVERLTALLAVEQAERDSDDALLRRIMAALPHEVGDRSQIPAEVERLRADPRLTLTVEDLRCLAEFPDSLALAFTHPRLRYAEVQVDKTDWDEAKAAAARLRAALPKEESPE